MCMKISETAKRFTSWLTRIGGISGAAASALVIFCSQSFAQSPPTQIQWAGVSFVGDAATVHQVFPISFGLTRNAAFAEALEKRLKESLEKITPGRPDLKIVTDRYVEQSDDTYVLSFAIASENVDTQQIDSQLYSYYELQAIVLLLNVSKDPLRQRVVTSYPVRIRWQDIVAREPDVATKQSVFQQLFLSPTSDMPDLIAEWGVRVASLKFREKNVWLRVAPLEFAEAASATLKADRHTQAAITLRATSLLEAGISKHLDIPIIPFSPSQATNKMTLTLANIDAVKSFVLAPADYQLKVKVNQLREVNANIASEGGATQKGVAFGAAFTVQMLKESLDSGGAPEVLFETVLKRMDKVEIREVNGEWKLSSMFQFSRLIGNFNHELASNIVKPDESWITRSKSDKETRSSSDIAAGLVSFRNRLH